jgi:hypothetical protein
VSAPNQLPGPERGNRGWWRGGFLAAAGASGSLSGLAEAPSNRLSIAFRRAIEAILGALWSRCRPGPRIVFAQTSHTPVSHKPINADWILGHRVPEGIDVDSRASTARFLCSDHGSARRREEKMTVKVNPSDKGNAPAKSRSGFAVKVAL